MHRNVCTEEATPTNSCAAWVDTPRVVLPDGTCQRRMLPGGMCSVFAHTEAHRQPSPPRCSQPQPSAPGKRLNTSCSRSSSSSSGMCSSWLATLCSCAT
jgi:hypothetical protein